MSTSTSEAIAAHIRTFGAWTGDLDGDTLNINGEVDLAEVAQIVLDLSPELTLALAIAAAERVWRQAGTSDVLFRSSVMAAQRAYRETVSPTPALQTQVHEEGTR